MVKIFYIQCNDAQNINCGIPLTLTLTCQQAAFAAAVDALGISSDSTVVVYDCSGVFSAPRVWWTFQAFGHDKYALKLIPRLYWALQ